MYYGRETSISCRKETPLWHGSDEIKFRNMGRKKILHEFLESLSDFKNPCQSRILVFVLVFDLQKRTPKSKNIIKNVQNQLQNDKNIIKNQKKCSKIEITEEVEIQNFDSKKKFSIAPAFKKYF